VYLVFRACKCWWLWHLGLGGDVSSREPCQLSLDMGNFCLQSGNSIVCGGQGTIIIVDCSIEHLINIVLEGMSGTPMHISQHQHFHFIPGAVLRVCAIPDECFPIFSADGDQKV